MSLAQNGMTDIYEMDMRTQAINRLTHSASIDTSPSYFNGKQVVHNSDRSGINSFTSWMLTEIMFEG